MALYVRQYIYNEKRGLVPSWEIASLVELELMFVFGERSTRIYE